MLQTSISYLNAPPVGLRSHLAKALEGSEAFTAVCGQDQTFHMFELLTAHNDREVRCSGLCSYNV